MCRFRVERVLGLILEGIAHPLFLQSEFDAEVGNVAEELMSRSNNHFRTLSLELRKAFGLSALTDKERIKLLPNVSREDVVEHYKATHTSSNMRFVIAGNFTQTRISQIKKMFGSVDLPKGQGRIELPTELAAPLSKPLIVKNSSVENMYFYIDTYTNSKLRKSEWDSLAVLNNILTETLYSRIFGTAREQGLVYYFGSGFSELPSASGWWFGAQVSLENAPKLMKIVQRELSRVLSGTIDDEDLSAAKAYALGNYQRSAQTVGSIVGGYSPKYFSDDIVTDYQNIPKRIAAVSSDSIIKVSRKLFEQKIWGFGVLGNMDPNGADLLSDKISTLWTNLQ